MHGQRNIKLWQCSAPYCPFDCWNNPRSVLRVSSTSAVLARLRPQVIFTSLDYSKRRWERQVFQVRRRGAADGTRVAALSVKRHFGVEYICGFVRWGGLQTKSMTSQRAANKMAVMRYNDKVMTTTRWRLYVTMETLWQQQDGGYAYHVINSTSSTVQS